ncbi:hypothetical protein A2592_03205 [Candidatus Kaiserbacteria bacterium RIFOXYD1_FULL_42_15]|uniref:Thioredoxin domain-containing protein n=1 Tax=Candidatus Kaiserbacteria bacterium RIFOXYD1_FULL_42_15 TaxID=1798532 RepID=A0A1F6FTD4_9BACT|nr:MAG: hypothetical protein A2592_03205 [Candidatus Kaiserbacteria bacterium RIFOXYD1_FULL_42_15]
MKKSIILMMVAVVVMAGVLAIWKIQSKPSAPLPVDTFAQCLKDKGATFYGAYWCPHCQSQKALFGKSAKLLPYVECSTPDGQSQTQVCIDKKITGYPTWEFADGSREGGELSFAKLAEKTGCVAPAQ